MACGTRVSRLPFCGREGTTVETLFTGCPFTDFGPFGLAPDPTPPRLSIVVGPRSASLKARVREACPKRPGVYGMIDAHGELIYVGKAKSLRGRLLSYFRSGSRDARSARIIKHTCAVAWEVGQRELAAIHRELELIRP